MTAAPTGKRRRLASLAAPLLGAPLFRALTHPHDPDPYVQLLDPTWSRRGVRAEIVDVRRTPGAVTLLARPNHNWSGFRAGQHAQLTVDVGGVRRSRCYSIVTSEHSTTGLLEFTVHAEPDGLVSNHLQGLRPGTVVRLSQAQGPFTLPVERPSQVLLISGGSGITPVLSMLRTLRDEGRAGSVTFLHYARSAEHVAYRAELDGLAAEGVRVLRSYTRTDGGELAGRFCASHLDGLPDVPAYVCGPAAFVEAVQDHWTSTGRGADLSVEHFTAPAPVAPVVDLGEPTGDVVFAGSGLRAPNTGAPLLEQAEAAGLAPVYGCRMGICFSCPRRKTEGAVRYANTGALHTEPDTDIQICVAVPVGNVTIDL